nr:hypothetical protein [Pseudanabaena sp. 'Roaring Creek']
MWEPNAPYSRVEDMLDLPDLSDRQKEILQFNLANTNSQKCCHTFVNLY